MMREGEGVREAGTCKHRVSTAGGKKQAAAICYLLG